MKAVRLFGTEPNHTLLNLQIKWSGLIHQYFLL